MGNFGLADNNCLGHGLVREKKLRWSKLLTALDKLGGFGIEEKVHDEMDMMACQFAIEDSIRSHVGSMALVSVDEDVTVLLVSNSDTNGHDSVSQSLEMMLIHNRGISENVRNMMDIVEIAAIVIASQI